MLNNDRIRLMTRLAMYEQGEGKEYMSVGQYYRKDYVGLQMLKTLLYSTLAFVMLFLLIFLYCVEDWMAMLYEANWLVFAGKTLLWYVLFELLYQVMAFFVYYRHYSVAMKRQKTYLTRLRKVEKLHEREAALQPMDEWED